MCRSEENPEPESYEAHSHPQVELELLREAKRANIAASSAATPSEECQLLQLRNLCSDAARRLRRLRRERDEALRQRSWAVQVGCNGQGGSNGQNF